jgi:glutaredoxin-like protein DUF836
MTHVVLYRRPGCHLCEDALEMIEAVATRVPFTLAQQNIETDPELHARYLERIPVITIDGVERFELLIDESAFEQAVSNLSPP